MRDADTIHPPVSAADPGPASTMAPAPSTQIDHLPAPAADRRWRLLDRLVVVVFCLGLVVPGALLAIGRRSAEIENRRLLTLPAFSIGGLFDPAWYTKIDRALTDIDPVRPYAVRVRGEAYYRLGGTGNEDVVRGTGAWLFSRSEVAPGCDLSAADIAAALDRTAAAFATAGKDFRFVIAPDKQVIYPERLDPTSPYPPSCTNRQRPAMMAAIASRSAFAAEGWTALEAARRADPSGPLLFFDQDSHWTPLGAIAGIRPLIDSLGPDLWSDADVVPGPVRSYVMELARQMGIVRYEWLATPQVRPSVTQTRTVVSLPFATTAAPNVFRIVTSGDRPVVPGRTVVVYDSFFGRNPGFVAPFFAETIWIHMNDLRAHPEIAGLIGPYDRVVFERVERGLYTTKIDELLLPLAVR